MQREIVLIRSKAGFEIRVWRDLDTGELVATYNQNTVASTFTQYGESPQFLPCDAETLFLAAWSKVSGFRPFTILRRVNRKFKPGVLSFVPAGKDVVSIKGRNGSYSVKYA